MDFETKVVRGLPNLKGHRSNRGHGMFRAGKDAARAAHDGGVGTHSVTVIPVDASMRATFVCGANRELGQLERGHELQVVTRKSDDRIFAYVMFRCDYDEVMKEYGVYE